jgi:hypothetical protein
MLYVSVRSSTGKVLMPCHPARMRELLRKGKAIKRFNKGLVYLQLTAREDGQTQPIAVGIDPGSKKEALTVKSAHRTFLNHQADAVTWVSGHMKTRRQMRRARRYRKTPYRVCRLNRKQGGIPPSTKARWQWKLRLCRWLSKLYPITAFVVEDIKAITKGKRKWDRIFSPLQIGKAWFYAELRQIAPVHLRQGWETKELRLFHSLPKSPHKTAETFEAHAVDAWLLANWYTGGHSKPDLKRLFCITPLRFHRRQLHRLQPEAGGVRKPYGSTRSHGFKRGSLVLHPKWGLAYVGGAIRDRISLHSLETGKRLTYIAKPEETRFLAYNSWRTRLLPENEIRGVRRKNEL